MTNAMSVVGKFAQIFLIIISPISVGGVLVKDTGMIMHIVFAVFVVALVLYIISVILPGTNKKV